jgi:hypothetical protein
LRDDGKGTAHAVGRGDNYLEALIHSDPCCDLRE